MITRTCDYCGKIEKGQDKVRGPYWSAPIYLDQDGKMTCDRGSLNNHWKRHADEYAVVERDHTH